jgi:alpha-tubulin suppressor-like RCC1 family protein
MHARSFVATSALLLAALGCGEDYASTTAPKSEPTLSSTSTLALRQINVGFFFQCAVTTANVAYCWGSNDYGQLGDGTRTFRANPVRVSGSLAFRQVSPSYDDTCGLTTGDLVYCWGYNYGPTPAAVPGGIRFKRLGLEGGWCGLGLNDRVYCWGYNDDGQLGDGTTTDHWTPRVVAGGRRYQQVSSSGIHACAVDTEGVLFCWGGNDEGQLGDGTKIHRLVPTRVRAGELRFRQVSAGNWNTCAVTTTDVAYCWGKNEYGLLGNGTWYQSSLTPSKVRGGIRFRSITTGAYHTCGLTPQNVAYCWGYGAVSTGQDTAENSRLPVPVTGGLLFRQMNAFFLACGVTTTNAGYCWGGDPVPIPDPM